MERKWFGTNWADIEQTQQPRYSNELKPWKLDNEIKTKGELALFLQSAIEEVKNIKKPTKKEMQWLKIACNDFVRIAKQKGWVD